MLMKIYLAGGMQSGWQYTVRDKAKDFIYFNPLDHGLKSHIHYTTWDLHYIRECDLVFAYLEKTNPSPIGMSLEIGYAKGLGKDILLVDEKPDERKFNMLRACANINCDDLEDGISYLNTCY